MYPHLNLPFVSEPSDPLSPSQGSLSRCVAVIECQTPVLSGNRVLYARVYYHSPRLRLDIRKLASVLVDHCAWVATSARGQVAAKRVGVWEIISRLMVHAVDC